MTQSAPPAWFVVSWIVVVAVAGLTIWRQARARRSTRVASKAETVRFTTAAVVKHRVFPRYWNPVMGPMNVTVGDSIIRVAAPQDMGVVFGTDWPFVARDCEVRLEPHVGAVRRSPAIVLSGPCGGSHVELAIRPAADLEETIEAMVRAGALRTFPSPPS